MQPSRGVLGKRCSENMQQIYRRTPGCSLINLLHIFKIPFPTNTSGQLPLEICMPSSLSGLFLVILPVIARVSYLPKISHLLIKKSFSASRSVSVNLLFDEHPILELYFLHLAHLYIFIFKRQNI